MNAYEGTENYIFISYAHKDSNVVVPIINAMQEAGLRVWYDSGIEAGSEWPEYIETHLLGCARFLAFISPASVASTNCRNEINLARTVNKEMLVVYLQPTQLAGGMFLQLNSVQALNMYTHPNYQSFINSLCKATILECCRDEEHGSGSDAAKSDTSRTNETENNKDNSQTQNNNTGFGQNPPPTRFTVVLNRKMEFFGCAMKITATFSSGQVYFLKVGESASVSLPQGYYRITFAAKANAGSELSFYLDRNIVIETGFNMSGVYATLANSAQRQTAYNTGSGSNNVKTNMNTDSNTNTYTNTANSTGAFNNTNTANSGAGAGTVTLKVSRKNQFFLSDPDMKMVLNNRVHYIKHASSITVPVPRGNYQIEFSASLRKKHLNLTVNRNMEIILSWNRITGEIEAEIR